MVVRKLTFLAGELGRYPIHFHLCRSVEGSVVAKNSIVDSNQRCVVVHGTHNLTVSENVAFENKGHCFMTVSRVFVVFIGS